MENRLIAIDPAEELASRSQLPVNTAKTLKVESQAELEQAGEIVRILKDLQDEINKVFKPIVEQAYKAHKTAKAAQNGHLAPLQEAEATLRTKINRYLREQEVERIAASLERAAAEENLKHQPAAKNPIITAGMTVPPPRLPEVPAPAKAEGMSTVLDWKWKVTDISLIPARFWKLDEKELDEVVSWGKGETQIPGIEVYSEARAVIRR